MQPVRMEANPINGSHAFLDALGVGPLFKNACDNTPALAIALDRYLEMTTHPADDVDMVGLCFLHLATDAIAANTPPHRAIRYLVQLAVSILPPKQSFSEQWEQVRRHLLTDAEATANGFDILELDAIP